MTPALLAGLLGLALLDALNPATIAGVALILLAPLPRPVATAAGFVAGAYAVVLGVGALAYLAAEAVGAVGGGLLWVRRTALGLAALALLYAALRRTRTRTRAALRLPRWLGPSTAALLGVLMTGADLPNAFPYFIAIERISAAGVPPGSAALLIAGYGVVYCLPCLALLLLGMARGERVRRRLRGAYDRLGAERVIRRSAAAVVGYLAAAVLVAWAAATV